MKDNIVPIFSDACTWIDMSCAPSRDGSGRIVGGIAIVRDITERKQAEEMLRISAIAFESQSAMIVTDPQAPSSCVSTGHLPS